MRHTQPGTARIRNADKTLAANVCFLSLLLCLTSLTMACGGTASSTSSGGTTPSGQLRVSIPPAVGTVGILYNAVSSVTGGSAPYVFTITNGGLPPGLVLNPNTGSITGKPLVAGTYDFTLSVSTMPGRQNGAIPINGFSTLPEAESGSTPAHIAVSASGSGPVLSISPVSMTLASQAQQQFTASISGSADTAVIWSDSSGTISSTGVFTAPKVTGNTSVIVTATSVANANLHTAATVTVTPVAALAITTPVLPGADASEPYTASLSATGGVPPYQWSFTTGSLPSGIQLQPSSGTITGLTTLTGSFPFTAKVTDFPGQSATFAFTLTVSSSSASGYDGPAQLPLIYIQTAMSNTPAPGSTIAVNSGGDLQSALNSANCGDTIQLQAGATFSGVFTFPAKSCDDNHWIVVRTSANDSALPAEGTRLTPCYAGVSSLPGRPAFQCASTNNVLAKLVLAGSDNGPVVFALGANHYRLIGLELTRVAGTGLVYALASVTNSGAANNLIFDRVWLHGTARDETNRGIDLGSSTYTSVVDSFFTDFHCMVLGSCSDAQAINGGLGDDQMGPYKIADNFLEASGENILFGGGEATVTPTDIEISRNHMFKPLTWMKGQPGYVSGTNGYPFVVKNLLELKNAQRVLVDGNIMENSWGGFSQVGFGILITPINQENTCPLCQVTDVTVRYNSISHVAAGIQMANALAGHNPPLDGQRYSIHDIVIDDIDGVKYNGPGEFAQLSVSPGDPILQNVTINHVTAFPPKTISFIGTLPSTQMKNLVFTNNIINAGIYPIWSTGNEGTLANCAAQDSPLITFNACFSPYTFAANAIIDPPALALPSTWPSGNFFPASTAAVQFVNYNGGNGGNYQLQPSSPYKGKGTDGKDLGADVAAIASATAGVE
jgi:hypothetical protein